MKEIKLNHGFVAIVDNNDYRHLNQFKWYAHKTHLTYYAKRAIYKNGKQEILLMHQIIVGKHKGLEIDHINHNGLDNRRCNLRTITHRENCLNRRKTNISGYVGVSVMNGKYYIEQIQINGKQTNLGSFKTAIEESKKGKLCVLLLPVSTSSQLFHRHILPNAKEIRFMEGRIRFSGTNTKGEYVTDGIPMHDSMVVVFSPDKVIDTPPTMRGMPYI